MSGCGNLRAHGHPSGRSWRQLQCGACHGYFYETHGTIFHGKGPSVQLIVRVIACLVEGLGIRGCAHLIRAAKGLAERGEASMTHFGGRVHGALQRLCPMSTERPTVGQWQA